MCCMAQYSVWHLLILTGSVHARAQQWYLQKWRFSLSAWQQNTERRGRKLPWKTSSGMMASLVGRTSQKYRVWKWYFGFLIFILAALLSWHISGTLSFPNLNLLFFFFCHLCNNYLFKSKWKSSWDRRRRLLMPTALTGSRSLSYLKPL